MQIKNINFPLVSIGVPVFNGGKGLDLALNSLIEQDYPNLEIIISDNGSTDTTSEVCEEYLKKDTRLKYLIRKMIYFRDLQVIINLDFIQDFTTPVL